MTLVVQANTPGGKKPGLLPHPQRTRRLILWLNIHGVGLVGMQELSTPSRLVWRLRRRWVLVTATPNDTGVWGLGRIGNGAAFRRGIWRLVRKTDLVLPFLYPLHILVAVLDHHELGQVAVYVVHLPGGAANSHARVAHLDLIATDAEARTIPSILLGDFNDTRILALLGKRDRAWAVAGHGVDWIATLGIKLDAVQTSFTLTGTVTDHPVLTGTVSSPYPVHRR